MLIQIGITDSLYVRCDDEITDMRPTPEWISDTLNRMRRILNDMNIEVQAAAESFERRALRNAEQEGDG